MFYFHLVEKISSNFTILNDTSTNSDSKTAISGYGGIEFINKDLILYISFLTLTFLGIVFGFLGNLLTIVTIITNKELHLTNYMIIVNLSIADFLISSFINIFNVIGTLHGETFFLNRKPLCTIIGFVCLICCGSSLLNIGILAVNRYIKICHDHMYRKVFSRKKTLLICTGTWFGGIALGLPNLIGWGHYNYDKKVLSCMTDRTSSHEFGFFYIFGYVLFPCCLIFICYLRIFLYVLESKKNIKKNNKAIQLAKSLFASFITYFICWMPFGIIYLVDYQDMLHPSAMVITTALAHTNSSVNAFYYAYFSTSFKQNYSKLFANMFPCLFKRSHMKTSNSAS